MATQPNLLIITCDQLRYDSVGYTGVNAVTGGHIHTPHIDSLAAQSLRFENAFTALPTCCPARQCMLAGKRAETFGALWNYDITSCVASLTPQQPTWSQSLHRSGYRMAWVGKWHVSPTFDPTDFGYDSYYSDTDYARFRAETYPDCAAPFDWFGSVDPVPLEGSHTHTLAAKAIEKIQQFARDSATPWHVRLDFSEPHLPCQPCKQFADLYDPAQMQPWPSFGDDFTDKPYIQSQNIYTWGNENATWKEWSQYAARYFAFISQTDDAIGRVLQALRDSGAEDNTVILFTADHGDMAGSHRMMDKHYVLYDDTVHVPLLLRAPGTQPRDIHGFVNNCLDMAPTLCDLCGAEQADWDGVSLLPLVENEEEDFLPDSALSTLNGQQFGLYTQRMLRTKDWKYIWNLTDNDELYDLQNDPWELHNLIKRPDLQPLLAEMRLKLYHRLKKEDPDIVKTDWLERQLLQNHKLTR